MLVPEYAVSLLKSFQARFSPFGLLHEGPGGLGLKASTSERLKQGFPLSTNAVKRLFGDYKLRYYPRIVDAFPVSSHSIDLPYS
jgi:hypothetical protein